MQKTLRGLRKDESEKKEEKKILPKTIGHPISLDFPIKLYSLSISRCQNVKLLRNIIFQRLSHISEYFFALYPW